MKYFALLILASLLAPVAFAQSSSPIINKSVNDNAGLLFLYEVDHGPTAQTVDFTVELTTISSSGIRIQIFDTEQKAVMGPAAETVDTQLGGGTLTVTHSLPSRTGAHPVLVIVQTAQAGGSVVNGDAEVNVGTMTLTNYNQSHRISDGLFYPFGLYASFNHELTDERDFSTTVTVDFGQAAQSVSFAFRGVGSELSEIRLYDVTGGDVLLETLMAAPTTGGMDAQQMVTTPSYVGEVTFRVEVDGLNSGNLGHVFWAMWMPSEVTVTGGSGDGAPGGSTSGGGGGGGCAVSKSTASWSLFALLVIAAAGTRLRRRV